jgi:hypothetical protein
MTEMSTSRSEMKKLAKSLVGADPEIFPPREGQEPLELLDEPIADIRTITSRKERRKSKSKPEQPLHDPEHVRDAVTCRLVQFAYLNDPPTVDVSAGFLPFLL